MPRVSLFVVVVPLNALTILGSSNFNRLACGLLTGAAVSPKAIVVGISIHNGLWSNETGKNPHLHITIVFVTKSPPMTYFPCAYGGGQSFPCCAEMMSVSPRLVRSLLREALWMSSFMSIPMIIWSPLDSHSLTSEIKCSLKRCLGQSGMPLDKKCVFMLVVH